MTIISVTSASTHSAMASSQYYVDESSLPFDPLPNHEDSTRLWGVHAGAGYRIEVPADWKGDLVMWTHGLRVGQDRLALLPPGQQLILREYLLDNGYAWAASTYSKNDYHVSRAVKDTRILATHFNALVDNPQRVYIVGRSMGAHVAALSVEKYPDFYAGALPVCGGLNGLETFDFALDVNLGAQQIALGQSSWPVDPDTYYTTTLPQIQMNLEAAPGSWPFVLNADGEAFKQMLELRSGGDRANYDQAWLLYNLLPGFISGGQGNFLFELGPYLVSSLPRPEALDNTDVVYQTDLDPALSAEEQALNDAIFQVAAEPGTRVDDGLSEAHVPPLTGNIAVPVLTMHNLGDLAAPFQAEIDYYHAVEA
ncbi:MAG: hypothetical protein R3272_14910, partial [Candidatus Promineifilaceae bacterium]|nr:hypothetical protein [Candidatus Promineifilaceae bacterium]